VWRAYQTPGSVNEALRLLADLGPCARIIAGGTDLLVEIQRAGGRDLVLIDVSRMESLDQLGCDEVGFIHLGPTITHNQAASSALLIERALPLALACSQVGTPQVRNRGTIAGNLITASPANDTITALWALDARLTLRSLRGERTLSCADFFRGVRKTTLSADEIVTDISFPALAPNQRGCFLRMGLRRANTIALVNTAAVLTFEDSRIVGARITLGSVAPTIMRVPEAEQALMGGPLSEERIAEAASLCAQAAAPISDIRGGADYRRETTRVLVRRGLSSLRNDAGRLQYFGDAPRLWGKTDGHFPKWREKSMCHTNDGSDPIRCSVNGNAVAVRGASGKRLLDMLRDHVGLTGTKEGCGEGECGACTVWLDGIAVLACLVPAPRAHGTKIVTIEGMARNDAIHPLQQAFVDAGAVQCGYCTPGFIMAGASLLDEIPQASCAQIKAGLSGNLCRCTGYYKIIRAVESVVEGKEAG
jgi:xanthine dehydrogenase iron-sulfur cluster and FAD-binding subunit A